MLIFILLICRNLTFRLKSIQKINSSKSPLTKTSRQEQRDYSINIADAQKSIEREKSTSYTNISSVRGSKHSHPMTKRSSNKPLYDSKKSTLNVDLKWDKYSLSQNMMRISEYYDRKDQVAIKPKTARKNIINDFSIQMSKEAYSPKRSKVEETKE